MTMETLIFVPIVAAWFWYCYQCAKHAPRNYRNADHE